MMSFELRGGMGAVESMLHRLQIPILAPSLGGVETLIVLPSKTSHVGMAAEERRGLGIADDLVRLSVGIEAPEDLIEDFEQALAGL